MPRPSQPEPPRHQVVFIDTSVLCALLDIPHMAQRRPEVLTEFKALREAGHTLVLPITTVIETGNHIAQLKDGTARRTCAERFAAMLQLVLDGQAPWRLHEVTWGQELLHALVHGREGVRPPLVELACRRVGSGDAAILVECEMFRADRQAVAVRVWTHDAGLAAHG